MHILFSVSSYDKLVTFDRAVYENSTDVLKFAEIPPVNCVCIAKFNYDGEWYRVTIIDHLCNTKIKVSTKFFDVVILCFSLY